MNRLGHLGTLYTNLPWTRLGALPRDKWRSQPLLAGQMVLYRLGLGAMAERVALPSMKLFSAWVARKLTPCDVFHAFSGFGLESFRAARDRLGALTIVERGSSHIRFQNDILVEEHARWGVPFHEIEKGIIEREEEEYALCDRITVQSSFAERTFVDRGIPAGKIIKLPLGVNLKMFHPIPKKDSTFRVLYAGHCSVRKGVAYLLEAVNGLELPNFELVINGSVSKGMDAVMARYASRYRFLGFQPLERLHEVYSQASVLVLPTIEDGFAKVITEAMACGVPVIATSHCGAPDVLEDGVEGFIVPPRSPEAIREKILYLYENPDVQAAMAAAALARVKSLTNWEAYGERAAKAYGDALAARRANP
ncbi:MAG TPA: glycosyltransferase family 4 protein [Polyangiaceae bacterium]|nr:glycosyltransferase family 4 protein [Polyangiaceae bacterium]